MPKSGSISATYDVASVSETALGLISFISSGYILG